MQIDILNIEGKKVGSADLADAVFGAKVKEYLLWELVKMQQAGSTLADKHGLPATEYASHGGAFPLTVSGAGVIGSMRSDIAPAGYPELPDRGRRPELPVPPAVAARTEMGAHRGVCHVRRLAGHDRCDGRRSSDRRRPSGALQRSV